MEKYQFSVVVPVFNSSRTLPLLYDQLTTTFEKMKMSFQAIFVNDGSYDDSWEILKHLHSKNSNIIIVNLTKNFGQQNALMCGFNFCIGEYIITIDDDLQNPPEEIIKLFQKMSEGYDGVFGSYKEKKDKFYKNLGSLFIRKVNHRVFHIEKIKFSSFRILKKHIIDEIKTSKTVFPYISGMILSITRKIANQEVDHHPRLYSRSNYSVGKLITLSFNLLINYSTIPLKFFSYFGLVVSILSFILGSFYLLRKAILGEGLVGWTSLFVFIAFINTMILCLLFIIGEYISRILKEISINKTFTIKEVLR